MPPPNEDFFMKFCNLLFFIASICIVVILGIMVSALILVVGKKKSVEEAVCICKDFIKKFFTELLSSGQAETNIYPTIVGYDGNRVIPAFVDQEFQAVRANFVSCYCSTFSLTPNSIKYRFNIQRKPDSLPDEILEPLIQKQAEEILAKTMRMYDCYLPTEPLTVVELRPEALFVAFAHNEEGIKQLDRLKQNIRRRKYSAGQQNHGSMTEEWTDRKNP